MVGWFIIRMVGWFVVRMVGRFVVLKMRKNGYRGVTVGQRRSVTVSQAGVGVAVSHRGGVAVSQARLGARKTVCIAWRRSTVKVVYETIGWMTVNKIAS